VSISLWNRGTVHTGKHWWLLPIQGKVCELLVNKCWNITQWQEKTLFIRIGTLLPYAVVTYSINCNILAWPFVPLHKPSSTRHTNSTVSYRLTNYNWLPHAVVILQPFVVLHINCRTLCPTALCCVTHTPRTCCYYYNPCCITHTPCTCCYYYNPLLCHSHALYVLLLLQPFVVSLIRPVRVITITTLCCITHTPCTCCCIAALCSMYNACCTRSCLRRTVNIVITALCSC